MSPGGSFFKNSDFSQILYSWGERFFVIGKISVRVVKIAWIPI